MDPLFGDAGLALVGLLLGLVVGGLTVQGSVSAHQLADPRSLPPGGAPSGVGDITVWDPVLLAEPGAPVAVVAEMSVPEGQLVIAVDSGGAVTRIPMVFDGRWLWVGEFWAEADIERYRVESIDAGGATSDWIDLAVLRPVDLEAQVAPFKAGRSWHASIGEPGSGVDFEIEPMDESALVFPPAFVLVDAGLLVIDPKGSDLVTVSSSGRSENLALPVGSIGFDIVADSTGALFVSDPLNHRIIRLDSAGHISTIDAPAFSGQFQAVNSRLRLQDGRSLRIESSTGSGLVDPRLSGESPVEVAREGGIEAASNVYDGVLHLLVDGRYLRISVDGGWVGSFEETTLDGAGRVWGILGVVDDDGGGRMLLLRVDSALNKATVSDIGFLDGDVTRRLARGDQGVVVLTQAEPETLVWAEQS